MTPELYVKNYYPEAKKVEQETGFHFLILLTLGALESNWGRKAPGHNFFGIKDTDGINGNEQLVTTTEYLTSAKARFPVIISIIKSGNKFKYKVKDWFRKYPSAEAGFEDYVNFILTNPRYKIAVEFKQNPERFFEEITKAGYATAPGYAQSLKNVMRSVIKRL
jgi:flagellum-specific peptidoglycan hydrolase FlgJ